MSLLSQREYRNQRLRAKVGSAVLGGVANVTILSVLAIFFFIAWKSVPFFQAVNLGEIFTSSQWHPERTGPEFGMLAMIYGSFLVTVGAMVFAIPISVLVAVVLSIMVPFRVRQWIKPIMELLAAVPSVAFGFFAIKVLAPWLQSTFGFPSGTNALNASIILAIMATPTIISVAEDALNSLGRELREASAALGATRFETIVFVILPAAKSGILAAIILGTMRAVGETMVVWMAAGNAANVPHPWYDVNAVFGSFFEAVRTMTATIAGDMGETSADSLHRSALFAVGLVLLVFTLLLNGVIEYLHARGTSSTTGKAGFSTMLLCGNLHKRLLLDRCFTILGGVSVAALAAILLIVLGPLLSQGMEAFLFRGTIEHRISLGETGDQQACWIARKPVYDTLQKFDWLDPLPVKRKKGEKRIKYTPEQLALRDTFTEADPTKTCGEAFRELRNRILGTDGNGGLLGPEVRDADTAHLPPEIRYGATHWSMSLKYNAQVQQAVVWKPQFGPDGEVLPSTRETVDRREFFKHPMLAEIPEMLDRIDADLDKMMMPRWTFYWRYFLDAPSAGHFMGGIGPEIVGTLLVTVCSIAFSLPIGVATAAYLVETARDGWASRLIRLSINTLAGVPSIVFGLFGLAIIVRYLTGTPCILAGSLTLGLMVLPLIIRASEEAIRSVPQTYREAALGLGASRTRCFLTVTLPASMPGILTGSILAMSRAAGETAPLLFTCAVATGGIRNWMNPLFEATPVLSYSAYDVAVGDRLAEMVPYNQYGLVATLILLVMFLNLTAIVLRGRIAKRLRGGA